MCSKVIDMGLYHTDWTCDTIRNGDDSKFKFIGKMAEIEIFLS